MGNGSYRHGNSDVRAYVQLGVLAQRVFVQLVRRVGEAVDGDLSHLADDFERGHVGHDLVHFSIPFFAALRGYYVLSLNTLVTTLLFSLEVHFNPSKFCR
jgi:hypothetical protein